MMPKLLFQNKYRIPSARAEWWNYGNNAPYFITICTQDRKHFFGEIMNTQFTASEIGNIAEKIWLETPKRFPHIYLDTFIVMPNHVHGIVLIDNPKNEIDPKEYLSGSGTESEILNNPLENPTQKQSGGFAGDKNPMLSDNLSGLIRWYKASVSFEARKINKDFAWQTRFHDHIIRSETSYQLISEYIINNPKNWITDKFYP